MKDIKTIHILGIITIIDFIVIAEPGSSIFLWLMYGFYKLFQKL